MCGIAGAIFWHDAPRAEEHDAIVSSMVDALAHRGPDGRGVARCTSTDRASGARATFGHARLSIIDLSERGRQPMASGRRPAWLTYNGEIYNFADIRRELERAGRVFTSQSDTEVLLQGYEEWGPGVIDRLRGMFAFAIWDGISNQVLIARDRLGIKPLYLYRDERCLLFASEIRSLLASGLVPRRLDPIAVDQYLAYQSVPAPRTLVENVTMLSAGHLAIASSGGRYDEREYWDPLVAASPEAATADRSTARRRVHELLTESVQLHLISDVPVGVFLSSGVDSTALVSLMRQSGVTARTFTVACPGSAFDESDDAREIARSFGADHTEIALDAASMCDELPAALATVDHPSGDGLNTFIVSHAVRQTGLKVALSGLGGDEFFGGYPSFQRLGRLAPYSRLWGRSPAGIRAVAARAVRTLGQDSASAGKAAALLESDGSVPQMFPVMRQVFSASQRAALLDKDLLARSEAAGDPYVRLLDGAARRTIGAGPLALVCYAEARTYMHDVLLRDTDQMSMAHGLEVRVPLLDHRLVEYVMGLTDDVRHAGTAPKPLLVESVGEPLPSACLRPKRGFVLPFAGWMRGPLQSYCDARLGPSGLAGRGIVNSKALTSLWRSFAAGEARVSWSRPWTLVALEAWLAQTGVSL